MANTILITTILDGTVNTIIRVNILGDGSGQETNTTIYHPQSYTNKQSIKRLMYAKYCLDGFSAELRWGDSSTGVPLITLEKDHYSEFCIDGGIPNNTVFNKDGKINITTRDLASGETGYIILFIKSQEIMRGAP